MDRNRILADLREAMETMADRISTGDVELDERVRKMYRGCFMDTAERTLLLPGMTTTDAAGRSHTVSGEVFVITGDINAQWLRDSSAQVVHYLPFAGRYDSVREMIASLIRRQRICILRDPYANAFLEWPEGVSEWTHDVTDMQPGDWEHKYETDSLSYHIWLVKRYIEETGDLSVIDEEQLRVFGVILDLWEREQDHMKLSEYRFERPGRGPRNNLANGGMGAETVYTGMTWAGFRPSDDACVYGYNIPGNLFAAQMLESMAGMTGGTVSERAGRLCRDIRNGVERYGLTDHEHHGEIYAYETDGRGNMLLMDDANVPSLLSLPWLGVCAGDDERYLRTRSFVLSADNPWYFSGTSAAGVRAAGVGSPHTGDGRIWPIALVMQGLTSTDRAEQLMLLKLLLDTDAGCCAMHEAFDVSDPAKFSRTWFAWADSLFALYVGEVFCVR